MEQKITEAPPEQGLWQDSTEKLVKEYGTNSENGLGEQEAKKRLAQDGYNELTVKKQSKLVKFIAQFNNSIIYI
ncbi:MAG: cation-transporting P-type ATPase, partial [Lentilactobacillus hilgardii]